MTGQQVVTRAVASFPSPPAPASSRPPADHYVCGLDLGQAADYTALAVDHVTQVADPERAGKWKRHHALRYLTRWRLGTSYVDIAGDVAKLLAQLPDAVLVADKTGVGAACVDLFRAKGLGARLVPVLITGGHQTLRDGAEHHVPKKELVSAVQATLQTRRLKVAPALAEAALLRRELELFRVKVKALTGNETFEAWRERDHDDLVLSVALAVWYGERGMSRFCFFC